MLPLLSSSTPAPPPPPPYPPPPTSTIELHAIEQTFVIAGSVHTFNASAFRQSLASSLRVTESTISLNVSAASVRVDTTITTTSASVQAAVESMMGTFASDVTFASAYLGVTVQSATAPQSSISTVAAPAPPSPDAPLASTTRPPPRPPPTTALSTSPSALPLGGATVEALEAGASSMGTGGVVGIGIGVGLVIALCLCALVLVKLLLNTPKGHEGKRSLGEGDRREDRREAGTLASTPEATTEHQARRSMDAESHAESPLAASAALFAACMLGDDDIDVTQFMHACREYTQVLKLLGSSTNLAVHEVNGNMAKIDKQYRMDPMRYVSMRTLLVDEMTARKHSADAGLCDPSAAVGLLWARRGLRYWLAAFAPLIDFGVDDVCGDAWGSGEAGPKAQSGYDSAMAAYAASFQQFNGFASSNLFKLTARAQPGWCQMGPKLAESPDELREGVAAWSEAVAPLLDRMAELHTELNLEDVRRGM